MGERDFVYIYFNLCLQELEGAAGVNAEGKQVIDLDTCQSLAGFPAVNELPFD